MKIILDVTGEKWKTKGLFDGIEDRANRGKFGENVVIQGHNAGEGESFFYLDNALKAVREDINNEIKLIITNSDTGFSNPEERKLLGQSQGETIEYFLQELRRCKENSDEIPSILFMEMSNIMRDRYKDMILDAFADNDLNGQVISGEESIDKADCNINDIISSLI